jgi:hypothetical protein
MKDILALKFINERVKYLWAVLKVICWVWESLAKAHEQFDSNDLSVILFPEEWSVIS